MIKGGLRWRTLALPTSLLATLAVLACALGVERIRSDFDKLESEEFDRVSRQAARAVERIFATEQMKTRDWAEWDGAAQWLAGGGADFEKSNLGDSTLSILGEDLLVYWDTSLSVKGALPEGLRRGDDLESRLREQIAQGRYPWRGLLGADSGLVFASIREVRNSDGKGPRRGWLAMAKKVDRELLEGLATDIQCDVWIDSVFDASAALPDVRIVHRDSVVLRVRLEPANGGKAFLAVGLGRPLHVLGGKASFDFFLHFAGASVSFVVLALFLLERMVLFRLMRLTRGVERIREEGLGAPSVGDPRGDEIGMLSRRIDEMVGAMRSARDELAAALERANAAERARVNFLASMTHELRTPLNGVIGLTEFVLKSDHDAETREALELSRGAALGLLETINGVLEYARLEKGALELVPDDVDLEASVVEPVRVLSQVAVKKKIRVDVRIDPALPSVVRLDAARLRQVLNNLVGNAIKFTDTGGVGVALTMVSQDGNRARIRLEVVDTGAGIPPDRLQAIFEPFEQATSETAVRFGGTGLGLTIANRIVRAAGSEIRVESRLGEGSRFHFEFEVPVVDRKPIVGALRSRRSIRIRLLLCDPALLDFVQRILWQMNLVGEVVVPGSGKHSYGTSHVVVLDSAALMERNELSLLPSAANLLVLSDPEHVRDLRIHLVAFRAEVVALPVGPSTIAKAIETLAIPKARVAVAVTGIVLRGMVTSMVERLGLVPVEARDSREGIAHVDAGECDLVVVDLDDETWKPLIKRCGVVIPVVGLADDPGDSGVETIVAKPVQAQRLLNAIETALADAPEGSDSKFWPDSSGADTVPRD